MRFPHHNRPDQDLDGDISAHDNRRRRPFLLSFLHGLLALFLVLLPWFLQLDWVIADPWVNGFKIFILELIYVGLGYKLHFRPNYAGMMPDRYSLSDETNQLLLLLKVIFWPGRFIGIGLIDASIVVFRPLHPSTRQRPDSEQAIYGMLKRKPIRRVPRVRQRDHHDDEPGKR